MNWRRGLLLAGINLAVAVPLLLLLEARDAAYLRNYGVPPKIVGIPPSAPSQTLDANDESGVNLCNMTDEFDWPERIVTFANTPDFILTGWRRFCPAHWQISGMLHLSSLQPPTPTSMVAQRKVDLGLFFLIPLQWFLVGAFPLIQPRKPWAEPGMLITVCTVLSAALFFITRPLSGTLLLLRSLGEIPAACAGLVWFWWIALLIWKFARSGWRWTARRLVSAAN